MPDVTNPLEIQGLRVTYGPLVAVDGLDLTIRPGEIYGLLGSNGAGKSSTIKSVVGLVAPSAGKVRVLGRDPVSDDLQVKRDLGYVPETPLLYDALTPWEFLQFIASVRRLSPADVDARLQGFAEAFQVAPDLHRPLATLSNGTRQKITLMAAFLHHPPLLILDEPFNNLDPRATRIMKDVLAAYVKDGQRAALFSTHTVEVAQQLCTRLGVLSHGKLKGEGTLDELRRSCGRPEGSLEEVYLALTGEEMEVARAVEILGGQR